MSTTLYLRKVAATNAVKPAGYLYTYNNVTAGAADAGAGAHSLASTMGTAQFSLYYNQSTSGGGLTTAFGQFLGPPLAAQVVASGTVTVGIAVNCSTTAWTPNIALYLVNGATGATRTSLPSMAVGAAPRTTVNAEITCYQASVRVGSFTPQAGDYIALEISLLDNNSTGGTRSVYISMDGTTAVASDNVAISDAGTFVTFSNTLLGPPGVVAGTVAAAAGASASVAGATTTPAIAGSVSVSAGATAVAVFSGTTLYLRLENAATAATKPAGFLQAYTDTTSGISGANAKALSLAPATAGAGIVVNDNVASGGNCGLVQLLGPALAAQSVAAGTATFGSASISNAGTNPPIFCLFLVNGATGANRTTIVSAAIGATASGATERTNYKANAATAAFTAVAGDYFCLELYGVTSVAPPHQTQVFSSGPNAITSDGAAISNPQSFFTLSLPIAFAVVPIAGTLLASAGASVSVAGATTVVVVAGSVSASAGASASASVQTDLYLRPGEAGSAPMLPSGFLAAWGNTAIGAAYSGANAKALSRSPGGGQNNITVNATDSGGVTTGTAQFVGPGLAAQAIAAVPYVAAFAASDSVSAWSVSFAAYLVNGSTGAIRTTLVAPGVVGLAGRTTLGTERTAYGIGTIAPATATAGDYIVIEVAFSSTGANQHGTVWGNGSGYIGSDEVTIASARSRFSLSTILLLALVQVAGSVSASVGASVSVVGTATPTTVPSIAGSVSASTGAGASVSGVAHNPFVSPIIVMPGRFAYAGLKPPVGAQLDRTNPLARGLLGAWLINEGTGLTILDSSGALSPGTPASGTPVTWVTSPYGTALDLSGTPGPASGTTSGIVLGSASQLAPATQVTVRVLIYLVSWSSYDNKILTKEQSTSPYISYALTGQGGANNTNLTFRVATASTGVFATALSNPTLNAWHDVVGTYDGQNVKLYVDGVLLATTALTGALFQPAARTVLGGADYYSGQPFLGKVAAAWIYDRALSASEVQSLYARPFSLYQTPPALRFLVLPAASVVGTIAATAGASASVVGTTTPTTTPVIAGSVSASSGASVSTSGATRNPSASSIIVMPGRFAYAGLKPPIGAQLDRTNPLARGLVGAWLLNDGTGLVLPDGTGNNPPATPYSNTPVKWVATPQGSGLDLGGTTGTPGVSGIPNGFKLGDAALSPTKAITVRAIVYYVANGETKILTREGQNAPYGGYTLSRQGNSNNTLAWYVGTGTNFNGIVASTDPALNAWHEFVATYDSVTGVAELYSDGVRVANAIWSGTIFQNGVPTILGGAAYWSAGQFLGKATGVWIYDRALSGSEIQSLYARPFAMYRVPPALRFLALSSAPAPAGVSVSAGASVSVVGTVTPTIIPIIAGSVSASTGAGASVSGVAHNPSVSSIIVMPGRFVYGNLKPPIGAQLDRTNPLARGLVGAWLLNEGTGLVLPDGTGNNPPAVPYSNTPVAWVATPRGSGLDLSGTVANGNVYGDPTGFNLGNATLNLSKAITVRAIVYYVDSGDTKIVAREDNPAPHGGYILSRQGNSNTALMWRVATGTNFNGIVAGTDPALNAWHEFVATYDSVTGVAELYSDGVRVANGIFSGTIAWTGVPTILGGAYYWSTQPFKGKVAGAWIYDRALSGSEVQALYARPFSMYQVPSALRFLALPSTSVASVAGAVFCAASANLAISGFVAGSVLVSAGSSAFATGTAAPASTTGGGLVSPGLSLSATGVILSAVVAGSASAQVGVALSATGMPATASVAGTVLSSSGASATVAGTTTIPFVSGSASAQAGVVFSASGVAIPSRVAGSVLAANGAAAVAPGTLVVQPVAGSVAVVAGAVAIVAGNGTSSIVVGSILSSSGTYVAASGVAVGFVAGFVLVQSGAYDSAIGVSGPAGTFGSALDSPGLSLSATGVAVVPAISGPASASQGIVVSVAGTAGPANIAGTTFALSGAYVAASGATVALSIPGSVLASPGSAIGASGVANPATTGGASASIVALAVSAQGAAAAAVLAGSAIAPSGMSAIAQGTAYVLSVAGAASAYPALLSSCAGVAIPATVSGSVAIYQGVYAAASGTASPAVVPGTVSVSPGANTSAQGSLSTGGTSATSPAATLAATGVAIPVRVAGAVSAQAGAATSVTGAVNGVVPGTAQVPMGIILSATGTPASVSVAGSVAAGAALAGTAMGVPYVLAVSGTATPSLSATASSPGIASASVAQGAVSASAAASATAPGTAVVHGVPDSPSLSCALAATAPGTYAPSVIASTITLPVGSYATAQGIPSVVATTGTAIIPVGASLSANGVAVVIVAQGTVSTYAGAAASASGTPSVFAATGTAIATPSASLSSEGVASPARIAGAVSAASALVAAATGGISPSQVAGSATFPDGMATTASGSVNGQVFGSAQPTPGAALVALGTASPASTSGSVAASPGVVVVAAGVAAPSIVAGTVLSAAGGAFASQGILAGSGQAYALSGGSSYATGTPVVVSASGTATASSGMYGSASGTVSASVVDGSVPVSSGLYATYAYAIVPATRSGAVLSYAASDVAAGGLVAASGSVSAVAGASASAIGVASPIAIPGATAATFALAASASGVVAPAVAQGGVAASASASASANGAAAPSQVAGSGSLALSGALSASGTAIPAAMAGTVLASSGSALATTGGVNGKIFSSAQLYAGVVVAAPGIAVPATAQGVSYHPVGAYVSAYGVAAVPASAGTVAPSPGASLSSPGIASPSVVSGSATPAAGMSAAATATATVMAVAGVVAAGAAAAASASGIYAPGQAAGVAYGGAGVFASAAGTAYTPGVAGADAFGNALSAYALGVAAPVRVQAVASVYSGSSTSATGTAGAASGSATFVAGVSQAASGVPIVLAIQGAVIVRAGAYDDIPGTASNPVAITAAAGAHLDAAGISVALGVAMGSLAATLSAVGIVAVAGTTVAGTAMFTFAASMRIHPPGTPHAEVGLSPVPVAGVSMPLPIAGVSMSMPPVVALAR